ncbi:MAG: LysR family transcriptional regulator [Moritella sp.]|uniref:LysR family transcriptional regulator n=1 Tax=Moritella sp. TaxID=78556 RepID=UPI00299FDE90|nr:LysR family transcriptional regulator [Moritella sp.]MDX2321313.1 LysR family transcriptional regulator [Moritella sp.]
MKEFDMNLIKPFIKVYEFNSFTKAADFLNVSQPAISASVKRLEEYLGYQLFIRSGRNLTATTSAQQFYQQVVSIVDVVDNAIDSKKQFIVTAPESILLKLIGVPNTKLIESGDTEDKTFNDLRMRTIDLAIDNITQKDSSFCSELIHTEPLILICCHSHPEIQGHITIEQYRQAGHVVMNLLRHNMRAVEFFSQSPILRERDVKVQVSSPANVMLAVQGTPYVAAIPAGLSHIAKSLRLQVLPMPFTIREIEYHMIYHKRFIKDPVHKKLRDTIKENLI